MIIKYCVTDWSGRDIYFESFDEEEANIECAKRNSAMDAYITEVEITHEDIENMSDEERKEMYETIEHEPFEELNDLYDDFWDWIKERL